MRTSEEKKAAACEYQHKYRKLHPEAFKASQQKWRQGHPDKVRGQHDRNRQRHPEKHKASVRKYKYGLTLEEQNQLLQAQQGVCAICGGNRSSRELGIDHDHVTGTVRGWLCGKCNTGLGFFADNPKWLEIAAHYLRRAQKAD